MKKKLEIYRKKDKGQNTVPDLDELDEEYIRRVEEMERELFADEDFEDYEPTEEQERESYARLIQRLKDDGIYCEDDNAEKKRAAGMENPRETAGGRRKIYFAKAGKVAGVAILCCACVFAASMTSEANRSYFVKGVRYLVGDDTRIVVDNDVMNDNVNVEEVNAIEDIRKTLNIDMPEFYYRPYGFEFLTYEMDEYIGVARIEYEYKEHIILFYVDRQDQNTASMINSSHGEELETITVGSSDNIIINIEKVQDIQDSVPSYVAQWEWENVIYHISGKISLGELEKMMEQMKF